MTIKTLLLFASLLFTVCALPLGSIVATAAEPASSDILTPPPPPSPRINGPTIFGVTPKAPFLYTIPVTGDRPMTYAVDGLPKGLSVNPHNGRITGKIAKAGTYHVTFHATNAKGTATKAFRIVCGDTIALTPPMGWNSWNCWGGSVDQQKVLDAAKAMVASKLAEHGWTYVNIDDTWQGKRGGPFDAIQGNKRFPDMKKLCEEIHALGLKAGIYSTPWITSYAGFRGESSDSPDGKWTRIEGYDNYKVNHRIGRYSFARNDARQWAAWGFDYLKYDWNPNDLAHTKEMALALKATGRDIVFSLSNAAPFKNIARLSKWANSWRTTGDIWDTWAIPGPYQNSVTQIGFNQDRWTPYARPGHWNDPDMLVIGSVGWGKNLHPTRLTHAEQYSHISLWCLLSAPLLIGCDLNHLDPFTLNLLTNDEVLAVDQDALGQQARRVATYGAIDVYMKKLEDGSHAVGFFNRGDITHTITFKLDRVGLGGKQTVRDLWRQKDLGVFDVDLPVTIEPHGVMLFKIASAPSAP